MEDFGLTWSQLLGMTALVPWTVAIVAALKRVLALSNGTLDRVGPVLGPAVAVFFAVIAALLTSADLAQAVLTGLVAGLASIGLYKVGQRTPVGGLL